jgi:hypothetical protein
MNKLTIIKRQITGLLFTAKIFPDHINQEKLIQQAANFFTLTEEDVQKHYKEYQQLHIAKQYEAQLGERKTLCFEEAFLLYLAVLRSQPDQVVEIGTQYGKSTRRILDILQFTGLKSSQLTCFDVIDEVKYFSKDEAVLELYDVTNTFRDYVLLRLKPGLIYLDAHPYWLLRNVISEFMDWSKENSSILTIHDCSPFLYKPKMKIMKEDVGAISSRTGHWERHVLSALFQTPNHRIDNVHTQTHRMRIFSTPHGLALIMPLQRKD